MKDAIGFGSVRDMVIKDGAVKNKYLLEEEAESTAKGNRKQ
jgi:hypothetical protein